MTRATHNLRQGAAQTTTGRRCDHRHAIIGEDARLHHLHITSLPRLAERRIPTSRHVPRRLPSNKEVPEPCRHRSGFARRCTPTAVDWWGQGEGLEGRGQRRIPGGSWNRAETLSSHHILSSSLSLIVHSTYLLF
jgi:hypothetical protein